MNRQMFWFAAGTVAALVLGWVWFITHFDRVPVSQREAPQAEARRNRYLALERFLARMQRPVTTISNAFVFDALPIGGTLILDRNRRRQVDLERAERLFAWVEAGGYLIANAESEGIDDPVLERLGVRWKAVVSKECGPGAQGGEEREPARPKRQLEESESIKVRLPGSDRSLKVGRLLIGLEPTEPQPQWRVEIDQRGAGLLHYAYGKGQITLMAGFDLVSSNWHIGEHDHADLIVTLLERYGPPGPVMLATRLSVPTLAEWLAESAWMALLSAALLLSAWLWRIMPRFGGVEVQADRSRRSLGEHLAAIGRYVGSAGGLEHWLAVVRTGLHSRLARRHPGIAGMSPVDQVQALATLTRLPREDLRFALHGQVRRPREFLAAVSALQRIERSL